MKSWQWQRTATRGPSPSSRPSGSRSANGTGQEANIFTGVPLVGTPFCLCQVIPRAALGEMKVWCNFATRLMGADPTTSRVTGECSTVELQPQTISNLTEMTEDWKRFVPMSGIEPLFRAYESLVLPLNYTGLFVTWRKPHALPARAERVRLVRAGNQLSPSERMFIRAGYADTHSIAGVGFEPTTFRL